MVGDDACTTFIELLKRMMDIFSSMEERKRNQAGKKIKPPKIKLGKLSKSDFRKLQKAGFDIKYVTVPAEKSVEVEENLLKMGGSFFKTEVGDSNIDSYIDMFKNELDIDEGDFRKFGAADNSKAQEFYQKLIDGELSGADIWQIDTPIGEEEADEET